MVPINLGTVKELQLNKERRLKRERGKGITDDSQHPDHDVGKDGDPRYAHQKRDHVPAFPALLGAIWNRYPAAEPNRRHDAVEELGKSWLLLYRRFWRHFERSWNMSNEEYLSSSRSLQINNSTQKPYRSESANIWRGCITWKMSNVCSVLFFNTVTQIQYQLGNFTVLFRVIPWLKYSYQFGKFTVLLRRKVNRPLA